MTYRTRIIIGIIIAALITTFIVIKTKNIKENSNTINKTTENIFDSFDNNQKNENTNSTNEYIENEVNESNKIEENTTNGNTSSNVVENEIIGKEEKDSNKEASTNENNQSKAIEMAKKEWAISIDSYDFEANLQSDGKYEITVREKTGNRNAIAIYIVDVKNNTIKEKYVER